MYISWRSGLKNGGSIHTRHCNQHCSIPATLAALSSIKLLCSSLFLEILLGTNDYCLTHETWQTLIVKDYVACPFIWFFYAHKCCEQMPTHDMYSFFSMSTLKVCFLVLYDAQWSRIMGSCISFVVFVGKADLLDEASVACCLWCLTCKKINQTINYHYTYWCSVDVSRFDNLQDSVDQLVAWQKCGQSRIQKNLWKRE